jgi:hypothetical protein
MKTLQYFMAGLLLLTGAIHVAQIALVPMDVSLVITVVFGFAYLAIGVFLFRGSQAACYAGALAPSLGLVLAVLGMLTKPTLLAVFFIAIDAIVVVGCIYLITHSGQRQQSHR